MKKCTRCSELKENNLFAKRSRSSDGLASWCKKCYSDHARQKYIDGDKIRKDRNKTKIEREARGYIWSVLSTSSCIDCGNSDPLVLEFDHRDGVDKLANISMMFRRSVGAIITEINKCDIRCANCHRKRTQLQFGTWRTRM
jgi:hypothetical protein